MVDLKKRGMVKKVIAGAAGLVFGLSFIKEAFGGMVFKDIASGSEHRLADNLNIDGDITGDTILANKKLKYVIKRDTNGVVQWVNLPNIGKMTVGTSPSYTTLTTAVGVNAVGANKLKLTVSFNGTISTGYISASVFATLAGQTISLGTGTAWSGFVPSGSTLVASTALPATLVTGANRAAGATAWRNSMALSTSAASIIKAAAYLTKTAQRDARTTAYLTGGK